MSDQLFQVENATTHARDSRWPGVGVPVDEPQIDLPRSHSQLVFISHDMKFDEERSQRLEIVKPETYLRQ